MKVSPELMIGSHGPALGINSPIRSQVVESAPTRDLDNKGGITIKTTARLRSSSVVSYTTPPPISPLKTMAEGLKGRHIDIKA